MTYIKQLSLLLLSAFAATYAFTQFPKNHEHNQANEVHEFDTLIGAAFLSRFLESEETRERMIAYASKKMSKASFKQEDIFLLVCGEKELKINPADLRGKEWITLLGSINKTLWLTNEQEQLPCTLRGVQPYRALYPYPSKGNRNADLLIISLEMYGRKLTSINSLLFRYLSSSRLKSNEQTYLEPSKETLDFVKLSYSSFWMPNSPVEEKIVRYKEKVSVVFEAKYALCPDCDYPRLQVSEIMYGNKMTLIVIQHYTGQGGTDWIDGHTKIYKKEADGREFIWSSDITGMQIFPFRDVDGDGFPEFTFSDHFDGHGLIKIHPKEAEITRNCSGG